MQSLGIPDHTLLHPIGRGAYGEVWLARNVVGTLRAVKVVRRADFSEAHPFEREFTGIQKFEPVSRTHPGLVDILQIGRNDAEGYFYYVMELADACERQNEEGRRQKADDESSAASVSSFSILPSALADYSPRTLRSDLRARGRLPVDECVTIGLALAEALAHLHAAGLVHRDIKPSNLIFVGGVPKLADIGLVADVDDARSFVGTEGFIPPEGPGTAQADLFSLGRVLYEMSMGRSRLDFPALPADWDALPPAEQEQLAEFNAVLLKACEVDPARRYHTAEELRRDLERLEQGRSIRRQRSREHVVRQLRIGAVAVALVAVAAWLVFPRFNSFTVQSVNSAPSTPMLAVLPFDEEGAAADDDLSARLTEEIRSGLIRVPRLRVIGQASSEAFKASPDRLAMARSNQVNAVLEGRLRRTGERMRVSLQVTETHSGSLLWAEVLTNSVGDPSSVAMAVLQGLPDRLGIQLTDAQRARLVAPPTQNLEAHLLFWEAKGLAQLGTEKASENAVQKLTRATQLDPNFALAFTELGFTHGNLSESDYGSPTNHWAPARAAAERAYSLAPDLVEANLAMAEVLSIFEYDWVSAEGYYRRSIELNPNAAMPRWYFGLFLAKAGRAAEARQHRERALALDPFEPLNPMNMGHQLFEDEGRPAAALPYYEQAYGLRPHPEMKRNFGEAYLALGRDAEALQAYEEYLLGTGTTPKLVNELCVAHANSGWPGYWQTRLAQLDRNPSKYYRWHDRAGIHDRLGQTNEVIASLKKSIENREYYATGIRSPLTWKPYRSDPRFKQLLQMLRVDEKGTPQPGLK